jgi:hypothetical protein
MPASVDWTGSRFGDRRENGIEPPHSIQRVAHFGWEVRI